MEPIIWLLIVALAVALAKACRDQPAPRGTDFLMLMPHLTASKKARGRGEVDHTGRTRRQRRRA